MSVCTNSALVTSDRVLRAAQNKKKLDHFRIQITEHRTELNWSLNIHSAAVLNRANPDIHIDPMTIGHSILPPELQEAEDWVNEHGGATAVIRVCIVFRG